MVYQTLLKNYVMHLYLAAHWSALRPAANNKHYKFALCSHKVMHRTTATELITALITLSIILFMSKPMLYLRLLEG